MRLLIADDHAAITLIATELAKQAFGDPDIRTVASVPELFEALDHEHPDLLLLDLSMPGDVQRIELLRVIAARTAAPRILVYSADSSPCLVAAALDAGADGYVPKGAPILALREAYLAVMDGKRFVDARITDVGAAHPWRMLTVAERDVLKTMMTGRSAKQVALDSGRSYSTIATLRSNALQKLGLRSNEELAAYFHEQGLLFELDAPYVPTAAAMVGEARFPGKSNVVPLRPGNLSAEDLDDIELMSTVLLGTDGGLKGLQTTKQSIHELAKEHGEPDLISRGFRFMAVRWVIGSDRLLAIEAGHIRVTLKAPMPDYFKRLREG